MSKVKLAIACVSLLLSAVSLNASPQSGPTTLIITYRCAPANRSAFRRSIERTEIPQFEKWKSAGVLANYFFLFNWYVEENTWDLMAVLSFHAFGDVARWHEVERSSPGGLSEVSLKLGAPTNTYSADLAGQGAARSANGVSAKSVFLVIPYDVNNIEDYKPYVVGYVIPQMEGWIREGVLSSYSLYLNRYYTGKPWDSLLILEYKDLESFGRRESVVARVRAALSADPKWKAFSDNKKNIRTERESVLAEELRRQ